MVGGGLGFLSHTPDCFEGVIIMFVNRPWAIQVFVMNIHNPFMHCVTSQCAFKLCDVVMLLHAVTMVTTKQQASSATPSPSRVSLNAISHQDSSTQWSKLRIWKVCYAKYIKLTRQESSQFHLYIICVWQKRERMVCAKWQGNALDWCYWIALPASPVVQSSNTVSCVSLSFHTHPRVLAIIINIGCIPTCYDTHANINDNYKCGGWSALEPTRDTEPHTFMRLMGCVLWFASESRFASTKWI